MNEVYQPQIIETKYQTKWQNEATFHAHDDITDNNINNNKLQKSKYYCLSMFAYPSGKLHMGHVRNYTIGDVFARFHRLNGYNVMQPMAWDAFGLPAENAAIAHNTSAKKWTYSNIENMKQQLQQLGLAVDWRREFATCDKTYYHYQQWLFIKLYEKGIIYKKTGTVNWDPVDETVLANEQVIDGKGWRSGALVVKKEIPMYYLRITQYADELLQGLDKLPNWPEQVKTMQKNWIGKSEGVEVIFPYYDVYRSQNNNVCTSNYHPEKHQHAITVFTTRIDTIMGVTFLAISNKHPILQHILANMCDIDKQSLQQQLSIIDIGSVSELAIAKLEKCGVFTNHYVIHPITNAKIPIWVTNYVLANYGTVAVMGVPAHCERDFAFANKYQIEHKIVIKVVNNSDSINVNNINAKQAIACNIDNSNTLINSGSFDDLNFEQAFTAITTFLSNKQLGKIKTNYRLHDWGISRQRYWGCPIPIIYCPNCKELPILEQDLPVILPDNAAVNNAIPSLKDNQEFCQIKCYKCGANAVRETDTMDTFVDSSWYYIFYTFSHLLQQNNNIDMNDDHNHNNPSIINFHKQHMQYWLSVDQYVGGIEHAILHLLYARFFHKCLRDLSLVHTDEPFQKLLTQGMVLSNTFYQTDNKGKIIWINESDVIIKIDSNNQSYAILKTTKEPVIIGGMEKMSKSKNNGVDPSSIIKQYGADTARLFMMFAAPPELSLEWSDDALEGSYRFIKKLWRLIYEYQNFNFNTHTTAINDTAANDLTNEQKKLQILLHQTIKKVTTDIQIKQQFNTAIASIMELLNQYSKTSCTNLKTKTLMLEVLNHTVIMLSPIIPHVCEELWQQLNPNAKDINHQHWPIYNEELINELDVEIIIQVNGKLRAKIITARDINDEELKTLALNCDNIKKFITDDTKIKKIIIVANKLINIVY